MNRHAEMLAQLRDCPEFSPQIREAAAWALERLAEPPAVQVKSLVWAKSNMPSWNDDWHTIHTGYTVRCSDEWGWKWASPLGVTGYERTSEAAKAAAQADYEARIRYALKGDAK